MDKKNKPELSTPAKVALIVHNLIYWFFLIPFFTPMSYNMGFIIYSIILLTRFIANTYVNLRNFTPAEYYAYPFRIP